MKHVVFTTPPIIHHFNNKPNTNAELWYKYFPDHVIHTYPDELSLLKRIKKIDMKYIETYMTLTGQNRQRYIISVLLYNIGGIWVHPYIRFEPSKFKTIPKDKIVLCHKEDTAYWAFISSPPYEPVWEKIIQELEQNNLIYLKDHMVSYDNVEFWDINNKNLPIKWHNSVEIPLTKRWWFWVTVDMLAILLMIGLGVTSYFIYTKTR